MYCVVSQTVSSLVPGWLSKVLRRTPVQIRIRPSFITAGTLLLFRSYGPWFHDDDLVAGLLGHTELKTASRGQV